jgi:hypothetical protein
MRAAARDWPLKMPPAAINCTGWPVNLELGASARILATAGMRMLVGMSPCVFVVRRGWMMGIRGWGGLTYCVAAAFTALSADHVGAEFEAFLDVLDVSDHVLEVVSVEKGITSWVLLLLPCRGCRACVVCRQLREEVRQQQRLGRRSDVCLFSLGIVLTEKFRARLDDDVNQVVQLALRVVVTIVHQQSALDVSQANYYPLLRLSRTTTNLREE